jgi:hypothetical protein
MFGPLQKSVEQKQLEDANFLYVYVYVYKCIIVYVYTPVEADVPKLSRVHMGCVRPKVNDVSVVY